PKAMALSRKALELDDSLGNAHALEGTLRVVTSFDWAGAELAFRRGLELAPALADTHGYYAFFFLRPLGRLDEAVAELGRALEIDPLSAITHTQLGHLHYLRREYGPALDLCRAALELDAGFLIAYVNQAYVHAEKGDLDAAYACQRQAAEIAS